MMMMSALSDLLTVTTRKSARLAALASSGCPEEGGKQSRAQRCHSPQQVRPWLTSPPSSCPARGSRFGLRPVTAA